MQRQAQVRTAMGCSSHYSSVTARFMQVKFYEFQALCDLLYFAVHNTHFFVQIFEEKVKMRIIHGQYQFRIYKMFLTFTYAYVLKV